MPRPFPSRCPACAAPRVDGRWVDPTTFREYGAVVRHDGACPTYRQRIYDRAEAVAHLLDLGVVRQ